MELQILNHKKIRAKANRIAVEILERNIEAERPLYLLGINNNGYEFAKLLQSILKKRKLIEVNLHHLKVDAAQPNATAIELDVDIQTLEGQSIIIVDDVANTGRTLFYAAKPLLDILPAKIECAVLVNRKHKSFPVRPDYVGMSLATTLQEHIEVRLLDKDKSEHAVYLV